MPARWPTCAFCAGPRRDAAAALSSGVMVLSFFRRLARRATGRDAASGDPLSVWDGMIEDLERQGTQVRRSAATLLALRAGLERDLERYRQKGVALQERLARAQADADERATRALRRDEAEAQRLLAATEQAWAQAQGDAAVLKEVADELAQRLSQLREERVSAKARLASGQVVSAAMRERVERLDRALALDAARDEVERAHQLAQIYRDERARE
jgi:phage shock protein A